MFVRSSPHQPNAVAYRIIFTHTKPPQHTPPYTYMGICMHKVYMCASTVGFFRQYCGVAWNDDDETKSQVNEEFETQVCAAAVCIYICTCVLVHHHHQKLRVVFLKQYACVCVCKYFAQNVRCGGDEQSEAEEHAEHILAKKLLHIRQKTKRTLYRTKLRFSVCVIVRIRIYENGLS